MIELLEGADYSQFKWDDEPGEYVWSLERHNKQQHKVSITVSGCTQVNASQRPKVETVHFEVKLKIFSTCVFKQMEKIRDLMTEKSYKEHRIGEFPFDSFNDFKSAFKKRYSNCKPQSPRFFKNK